MEFRKVAVCVGVQTATGGRMPVRCHSLIRSAVQTTALGRRAEGSSAREAALAVMCPARMAAFKAARIVAFTRTSVAVVTGRPIASCWRLIAVNIACTWPVTDQPAGSARGREPGRGAHARHNRAAWTVVAPPGPRATAPATAPRSAVGWQCRRVMVLATSLIGDVPAAFGEHVLATLDEHCGYFRRRGRGQADRVNTAIPAAGPS